LRMVGNTIGRMASKPGDTTLSFSLKDMCEGISYTELNLAPDIAAKLGSVGAVGVVGAVGAVGVVGVVGVVGCQPVKPAKLVKAAFQALHAAQQVVGDLDLLGKHDCMPMMPIMVNIFICVMCLTDFSTDLGLLTSILSWLPARITNYVLATHITHAVEAALVVKACTPNQLAKLCVIGTACFKQFKSLTTACQAAHQHWMAAEADYAVSKQSQQDASMQLAVQAAAKTSGEQLYNLDIDWKLVTERTEQAGLVAKRAHQALASASRKKLAFNFVLAAQLANKAGDAGC